MATQTYSETLTLLHCSHCGIPYGLSRSFEARRREDHQSFWCPSGHSQYFPQKSKAEELEEKLESEKRNSAWWRARKMEEEKAAEHARRQRDAYKGHTTRLKKRVAKGKCPCCSSTFVNLRSHMTKQHPDYVQEETGAEVQAQAD